MRRRVAEPTPRTKLFFRDGRRHFGGLGGLSPGPGGSGAAGGGGGVGVVVVVVVAALFSWPGAVSLRPGGVSVGAGGGGGVGAVAGGVVLVWPGA
jgi:hypothetical protein